MRRSPYPKPSLQLFQTAWIERLTIISLRGFLATWSILLPLIGVAGFLLAPTIWAPALLLAGALVWFLVEYGLHRFPFHYEANSPLLQRLVFIIHGNHHADTNDPLRNLMPPIVSVPVGLMVWGASVWAMGLQGTWFLLGFMMGYAVYDLVHYACHQFPLKGRFWRALKKHHMRHHHLDEPGNYAITAIMLDRLFGTRIETSGDRAAG